MKNKIKGIINTNPQGDNTKFIMKNIIKIKKARITIAIITANIISSNIVKK